MLSIATLFINAFVIYAFFTSKRNLQGTSLILVQVAFNDFISGKLNLIRYWHAISSFKLLLYQVALIWYNCLLIKLYGFQLTSCWKAAYVIVCFLGSVRRIARVKTWYWDLKGDLACHCQRNESEPASTGTYAQAGCVC